MLPPMSRPLKTIVSIVVSYPEVAVIYDGNGEGGIRTLGSILHSCFPRAERRMSYPIAASRHLLPDN